MYPYHTNTRLYNKKQPASRLQTRNRQEAPLSSDRRLYELLLLALEQTAKTEQQYAALAAEDALADAEELLRTMQIDEKKHRRILREILFTIYGAEELPAEIAAEASEAAAPAETLLEELLLAELDEVGFYRDLLFAMESMELRDFFYEIISNKQNHTAALNHLYAKYFAKNTGNPT